MMGCGGRSSRTIFDGLRRYNSKLVLHSNPIQQSVSRRTFSLGEATILHNGVKNKQRKSPFVDGAKKFYNAGSNNQVQEEFKASRGWRRWIWNLESTVALALFSGLVALDIFTGRWETVPYTKRSQFMLLPSSFEESGTRKSEEIMKYFKKYTLPPLHPDSVRVRTILWDLIKAFRRKEGDARIRKRWEVLVVDFPFHSATTFPGGNIVIFTNMLDSFKEDAEIAAFIALEVGHAVARHSEEKYSMSELLCFLYLLILHVLLTSMPSLLKYLRFPFARSVVSFVTWMGVTRLLNKFLSLKMDMEADYIGMLLVASAGYDPRVALKAREKMGSINGGSSWEKMRARLLVLKMEEALSIYREVMAERDV